MLEEHGVEMIGADREAIRRRRTARRSRSDGRSVGLQSPESAHRLRRRGGGGFLEQIGLPAIIRPAFTLGGTGGGVAWNREEFEEIVRPGHRGVDDRARC